MGTTFSQLTKDDWHNLVRDALKRWYDSDELNRHPLTGLRAVQQLAESPAYSADPHCRAKALRETLRSAVAALDVDGAPPLDPARPDDPGWMDGRRRHYAILALSPHYPAAEVASRVGLALGGQFYRDQARAYDMAAEVLRVREGNPIDEASPAALAYPSGAVRLDDPFYVERTADARLAEALGRPGDTITIRGPRQVGKTSLLIRGVRLARRRFDARVVYFDLQGAGREAVQSLDAFLLALAGWFFDELELDPAPIAAAWDSRLPPQRKLTKLLETHVLADERPVLLAMDEIDQLQLTTFHSEVFALIRSWHNRRAAAPLWDRLTTIMAISTEPYLLIDDLNQSPFNVGHVLNLRDFDQAQAADLNTRYGAPLKPADVDRMMGLLSGHPYLTRVALYTLTTSGMTWPELDGAASSDQGPFHRHLRWQHRLLARAPRLQAAMKEIIQTNRCADAAAAYRLVKAGLATKIEDNYVCRCELYRRYFAGRL